MAFSQIELGRIEEALGGLCQRRNRPEFKDQLSLEYRIERHNVIVFERRPRWDKKPGVTETPVAKLTFTRTAGKWRLFWMRGNLKWCAYKTKSKSGSLSSLASEIDSDVWGCFFG